MMFLKYSAPTNITFDVFEALKRRGMEVEEYDGNNDSEIYSIRLGGKRVMLTPHVISEEHMYSISPDPNSILFRLNKNIALEVHEVILSLGGTPVHFFHGLASERRIGFISKGARTVFWTSLVFSIIEILFWGAEEIGFEISVPLSRWIYYPMLALAVAYCLGGLACYGAVITMKDDGKPEDKSDT